MEDEAGSPPVTAGEAEVKSLADGGGEGKEDETGKAEMGSGVDGKEKEESSGETEMMVDEDAGERKGKGDEAAGKGEVKNQANGGSEGKADEAVGKDEVKSQDDGGSEGKVDEAVKAEVSNGVEEEAEINKLLDVMMENVDVDNVSFKNILDSLSSKLGRDMRSRKLFIKERIVEILRSKAPANLDSESGSEDSDNGSGSNSESDSVKEAPPKTRKNSGFNKPLQLSTELYEFFNKEDEFLSRGDVVKKLWAYFKEKDLQDPKNRRNILLDEPLQKVFKCKKFSMFSMNKKLSSHLKNSADLVAHADEDEVEDEDEDSEPEAKAKRKPKAATAKGKAAVKGKSPAKGNGRKRKSEGKDAKPEKKKKKAKRERGEEGPKKPRGPLMELSDDLAKVVGVQQLQRPEVVKQLWVYIKAKGLQNPSNKQEILCDDAMKAVMGKSMVTMFEMNKLITPHFLGKATKIE
ncbi:unnamed protein product [Chrysoparadoxa australica]